MKSEFRDISIDEGKISNLFFLKRMALVCLLVQFWTSIFHLFCSLLLPQSYDAALICGILSIVVSLTPVLFAITQRKFILIFSCISFFNISPIWFLYLEAVLPGYDAYEYIPPALRMETFFWVDVFLIFVDTIYLAFWRLGTKNSIKLFSFLGVVKFKAKFYHLATIFCFVFPLVAFFLFYRSYDILWTAITAGRAGGGSAGGLLIQEPVGTESSFMLPVNSIWQLTPLFGSIAFMASKKKVISIFSIILGIIVSFVFFLSGSRGSMVFVIAPMFFFLFYYNWDRGLKFWTVAIVIIVGLIGVMELQVRFRGNLLDVLVDPAKAAQERGFSSATTFDPTESHRDNNMYLFCLMVQGYPQKYSFQGFNDFVTVLVNPIPRAIWPDKPLLLGAKDLSQQASFVYDGPLFMGTTSLSYSVVGEAYQSGGIIGLLVYAIFYGLFVLMFDGVVYYTHRDQPIAVGILGVGVFLAFWGFRAFFALISFLYPIAILIVFLKLLQLMKSNENHVYSA